MNRMDELKLKQILFQEAAQSVEGSLGKGIAALGIPGMAPFNNNEALDLAADLFFHRRYEH